MPIAALGVGAIVTVAALVVSGLGRSGLERLQGLLEVDFNFGVSLALTQDRNSLPVPGARPADRMANRHAGWIAADYQRGQLSSAFQLCELLPPRWNG